MKLRHGWDYRGLYMYIPTPINVNVFAERINTAYSLTPSVTVKGPSISFVVSRVWGLRLRAPHAVAVAVTNKKEHCMMPIPPGGDTVFMSPWQPIALMATTRKIKQILKDKRLKQCREMMEWMRKDRCILIEHEVFGVHPQNISLSFLLGYVAFAIPVQEVDMMTLAEV